MGYYVVDPKTGKRRRATFKEAWSSPTPWIAVGLILLIITLSGGGGRWSVAVSRLTLFLWRTMLGPLGLIFSSVIT
jgi:hypothetical protein